MLFMDLKVTFCIFRGKKRCPFIKPHAWRVDFGMDRCLTASVSCSTIPDKHEVCIIVNGGLLAYQRGGMFSNLRCYFKLKWVKLLLRTQKIILWWNSDETYSGEHILNTYRIGSFSLKNTFGKMNDYDKVKLNTTRIIITLFIFAWKT